MTWYKNKLLKKLFLETTEWNVAWKHNGQQFQLIENPKNYWFADSLLFKNENSIYLFVEAFDKQKNIGKLGVFEYDGSTFSNFRIVMEKDYHLSYPFVFSHNGDYYMIPETSGNHSIELYKAKLFPDEWEFEKTLLYGNYVDTTLTLKNNDEYTFFSYDMNSFSMIKGVLSMKDCSLRIITNIEDTDYICRAGGNVYRYGEHAVRALQNNMYFYGQSLRIVNIEDGKTLSEILPSEIITNKNCVYRRIHTYSNVGSFEAIDLSDYRFNLFKPLKKLKEKVVKRGVNR